MTEADACLKKVGRTLIILHKVMSVQPLFIHRSRKMSLIENMLFFLVEHEA